MDPNALVRDFLSASYEDRVDQWRDYREWKQKGGFLVHVLVDVGTNTHLPHEGEVLLLNPLKGQLLVRFRGHPKGQGVYVSTTQILSVGHLKLPSREVS